MKNKVLKLKNNKIFDKKLATFLKNLDIFPNNWEFFEKAFIHASYINEHEDVSESYDRLEFLGDALIDFVVAKKLFELYPKYNEGLLTRTKIEIVKGENLNRIGIELKLGDFVKLSNGAELTENTVGDVLEALVGAIYEDMGMKKATEFVEKYIFERTFSEILKYDFFSLFQEQKLPEPRVRVSLTSNNLVLSIIELDGDIIWSQAIPNNKNYDDKSVLEHNAMASFTSFLKSSKGSHFFSDLKEKIENQKMCKKLAIKPKKIRWNSRKAGSNFLNKK
ncbi:ribonuclease III [Mycoplasmoides genitalium]|uniref:ribonuclease III n=1 Tax=Mycoplasmoides genitalium TaxID=2097 RepID=UPI002FCE46D4